MTLTTTVIVWYCQYS